jgi:hypothetical protein
MKSGQALFNEELFEVMSGILGRDVGDREMGDGDGRWGDGVLGLVIFVFLGAVELS